MNSRNNQRQKNDLLTKLEEYCDADYVPMHMPGAKRNTDLFQMSNPYQIDITEIDGFDNLHHPEEMIADSMKDAAEIFGAEETLYLINGSSAGILSAICGGTKRGDTVLVARNCHVSVYNAIYMNGLKPIYFQPKCDAETGIYQGVTIEEIGHFFKDNDIVARSGNELKKSDITYEPVKAVILTSPTYEGYVSQVKEIADFLHERDVILIVDEAHGAHFPMDDAFPESANRLGADAVIQSIHKTLPSLTQTALLHLNGNRINRDQVKMYWNIYQTTSPSYVLMGGIDRCMSIIKDQGNVLFSAYVKRLQELRERLGELKHLQLLKTDDISKLVIIIPRECYLCNQDMVDDKVVDQEGNHLDYENVLDGKKLHEILLNQYHIQLEMASIRYVIAMTSVGDRQEYYDRFANALMEIDGELSEDNTENHEAETDNIDDHKMNDDRIKNIIAQTKIDMAMIPVEAIEACNRDGGELVEIELAKGRISGAQICMYPPGIPVSNPGERITAEVIEILKNGMRTGLEIMGLKEGKILCLK